jgi:hypothetical protein
VDWSGLGPEPGLSRSREIATGGLHMPLNAGLQATTGPVCKVYETIMLAVQ